MPDPCECIESDTAIVEHYDEEAVVSLVLLYKFLRDHERELNLDEDWRLKWECHDGGIKVLEFCEKRHWVYIVRPCLGSPNYQQALWKFEQELHHQHPQLYDEYVKYVYIKGRPEH